MIEHVMRKSSYKILGGRFFYVLILIDEYSRYIVHYILLISMDTSSFKSRVTAAIENIRTDSIAKTMIQSENDISCGNRYI